MAWSIVPPLWISERAVHLLWLVQQPFRTAIALEVRVPGRPPVEAHPFPGCALARRDARPILRAIDQGLRQGGVLWVRESLVGPHAPVTIDTPHNLYGVGLGHKRWTIWTRAQALAAHPRQGDPASVAVCLPWPEALPGPWWDAAQGPRPRRPCASDQAGC